MSIFKIIFGVLILTAFGVIEANAIDQSICASGKNQVLYPNGLIKICYLKDSFSSNEITCKGQNSISFYDNGQLETCVLEESAKVGGQDCKESGLISFYPDGKLKSCEALAKVFIKPTCRRSL